MSEQNNLSLYIGSKNILDSLLSEEDKNNALRKSFEELIQVPNLCFLIGAGCSSDLGVPMMGRLDDRNEFDTTRGEGFNKIIHDKLNNNKKYKELVRLFLGEDRKMKGREIEPFLGYLFKIISTRIQNSTKDVYKKIKIDKYEFEFDEVEKIINTIKKIIYNKCSKIDNEKLSNHKQFIKKILSRDPNQSLDRVKIYTTNYDLAFEESCDSIGVSFFNGFIGSLKKVFNPASFSLDIHYRNEQKKMQRHDKVVDLIKLHGSVNWIKELDDNNITEINTKETPESDKIMIYPTPLKVESSLEMPYSELFRNFYSNLIKPGTTLIVIGYSFGDSHINEIILQALTYPSFRLVVLGDKGTSINNKKLIELNDPRIWIANGQINGKKCHYFDALVNDLLPTIDKEVEKIEENIAQIKKIFKNNE